MRLQRSLSGKWAFQVDPNGELQVETVKPDREITVPMPWGVDYPELLTYSGYAWYQRSFDLEETQLNGEILLHFGAVDYWCEIYVNGQRVGEHEGGYTPFAFPICQYVRAGANTVTVRVYDSVQTAITIQRWHDPAPIDSSHPPFDARTIPHGKQDWYLNVGGIWQEVALTTVPRSYITQAHISPDIHTNTAKVVVEIIGGSAGDTLHAAIADNSAVTPIVAGQTTYTLSVSVAEPKLWTPDTPDLYTGVVTLSSGGDEDVLSQRFGFREITTQNGQILLNGKPFILLCALDQDCYQETIYTVPSDDYLRDQFLKAKELGLNSLRCHIKVPDPRYLDLADEIGLLIWSEIPSWRTFHPKTSVPPSAIALGDDIKNRVRSTLQEIITRDYNHPSLMIYTLVNEDWGTALMLSAADRRWLLEMVDFCKSLDSTRLVVDNSPCPNSWGLSMHVKTDLDDFHVYTNIPDSAENFEKFIEQYSLHPAWSFTTDGTAQRTGHEPLVLSEFGNWGLPSLRNIAPDGEPDWFKTGPWWSTWDGEPGYPAGVTERFTKLGLNAVWPDYEAFAEATQWHQFAALKFEIETLRRHSSIAGYVITEFSDIYWESNGLLDFARCPKVYHEQFKTINAPDVIAPKLKRYAYWDDEAVHADVYVSHYSDADWSNNHLLAGLDGNLTQESIPSLAQSEVGNLGVHSWRLPQVQETSVAHLSLRIQDGTEQHLAVNDVPLLVLPTAHRTAAYAGQVAVIMHSDHSQAAETEPTGIFHELGYHVINHLADDTRLAITDYPTQAVLDWVRAGGDLLFLNNGTSPFFWSQGRGGAYSGNWMTSFSWLRPGIYRRLSVSSPVTLPFMDVMPTHVILGLSMDDAAYHQDILAGQVTGWIGHPAAHTIQFRCGRGRVLMTTYDLKDQLDYHPAAVAMLHDLVDHLTSATCQPHLTAG